MKKLNEYFFGSEEVALSDMAWFYGSFAFIMLVGFGSVVYTL